MNIHHLHTYMEYEHPNKARLLPARKGEDRLRAGQPKRIAKRWGLWIMILCLTGLRESLSKVEVRGETESKSSHWDVSSGSGI